MSLSDGFWNRATEEDNVFQATCFCFALLGGVEGGSVSHELCWQGGWLRDHYDEQQS